MSKRLQFTGNYNMLYTADMPREISRKGDTDMEFNETMKINLEFDKAKEVREIVTKVYEALKIKGYDPISQIVGYILSGDPTYITSYNGARSLIVKIERDELLEEFAKTYIDTL